MGADMLLRGSIELLISCITYLGSCVYIDMTCLHRSNRSTSEMFEEVGRVGKGDRPENRAL